MKYLSRRGKIYQFERSIRKDLQPIIGQPAWRESLFTDSETEAEALCRKRTVETDEIIAQAKAGTLRQFTDDAIEDLAIRWSIEFQLAYEATIAYELFPDYAPIGDPVAADAPSKIFQSRKAIEAEVTDWAASQDDMPVLGSTDWEKLIDECIDTYLVSNPHLPGDWMAVLEEHGFDKTTIADGKVKVVPRTRNVPVRNRLLSMFDEFLKGRSSLDRDTLREYKVGVRRFVDLHGDIDVTEISRVHVEQYRNALRQLPSRPPNQIREQSLTQQIEWGLLNNAKTIGQAAINKNLLGVKQTLEFAFWETAVFTDRTWTNPFDGFSKKPKKSKDPIRPFSSKQLEIIFSRNVYKTKTAEKFWIPLILFYTGARLDEISQLHVADVLVDPVPHFLAENLEDEDPTVAKKLKTESSHRTIPIHRALIGLGLLEYVEAVKKSGERHLFPGLPHTKNAGRGDAVSRDFIRRFRRFGEANVASGLNTKSLVTHSLRHAFRTAALYLPDQTFVMIAMGHYVPGESIQTYGKQAYLMPDLLSTKVMEGIALPQLDQAFLRKEADRYLRQVAVD